TTAGTSPFYFKSVDLYSSITPIPYVISGVRNGSTIFTMADTLPNTFGRFRTVASQNTTDAIDTLSITLTNAPPSCITCQNPNGLQLPSNQKLSFQLVHLPPAPAPPAGTTIISFNGLTANSASISSYTESGFTVLPASAAWVAVTTYGNPAPSIQFFGQVGTA